MKSIALLVVLAIGHLGGTISAASAAALQVEPVLLEMTAPSIAGTLNLRNDADIDVAVQTRVFRWSQSDGHESLEATSDVVVSPPIVTLAPRADYTVRVVRVTKTPLRGEESYRVLVDQLPDPRGLAKSTVNILIRQSIPVFFKALRTIPPGVAWSLRLAGGRLLIGGSNSGDERMRVASLQLRDAAGTTVSFGNGLAGYVLGRSSMNFIIPNPPHGFGAQGTVSIAAESNNGPVHATAPLQISP
jgi:fimbrial chaperone protein